MGTWSSVAARSASRRARATQSSIVASRTGTNGTTSVAPIRGCSPVWRERSIRSVATRMAASAASTLASGGATRSEEHTSELQSLAYLVCRLLLEKKKKQKKESWQYSKEK